MLGTWQGGMLSSENAPGVDLYPHPASYPQHSWQDVAAIVPDRCPSRPVPDLKSRAAGAPG